MRVAISYEQQNSKFEEISFSLRKVDETLNGFERKEQNGLMGVSADVLNRKKAEQFEKFKALANQAAHDIRTPLDTLTMALNYRFKSLSKEEHMLLSNLTNSIRKIAQVFLDRPKKEASNEETPLYDSTSENYECTSETSTDHQHILVSQALAEIIDQKKLTYYGRNVEFKYSFDPSLRFTFIYGNSLDFERMMRNLIKNSVEAFEGRGGVVKVGFTIDDDNVKITVEDNGKGMPQGMVEKLMRGDSVSTTKVDGHGIGTQQIRDALAEFGGTQLIESTSNVGTKITLTIPKSNSPKWVMKEVYLNKRDVVVILDDDISIHQKWKERLEKYTPKISLKFFTDAQKTIDFINSYRYKDDIRFLSDYELRGQELSGLDVVRKCGLGKYSSSLISSTYNRKEVQDKAAELNVSILSKAFLDVVAIDFDGRIENHMSFADANVIVIDDDGRLANTISNILKSNSFVVDTYYDPHDLIKNLSKYNVNTKIITDNCFDGGMNGDALVKLLWGKGFRNICVLSGYERRDVCSKYPLGTDFVTKGEENVDKFILRWCKSF